MIYVGIGPDGDINLPAPIRIRLDRDADAPADAFEGVFPSTAGFKPITFLKIFDSEGNTYFDGIVDEQEYSISNRVLTLSARSRAALLLDNEAMPQNYMNPSLATIFNRHILPYGFTRYRGNAASFHGTLAITKGMSEWTAAAQFCSLFLKTEPRMIDGVFDASGQLPQEEIVFGKGGIRFHSGVLQSRYCKLYSDLYALDEDGGTYKLSASSSQAHSLEITRKRFLSNGVDAAAVLQQSEQDTFEAVLDCPGRISAPLLSPARIAGITAAEWNGMRIFSLRYVLDAEGEHTRVILRRK
ncbi:MAG: Histidine kinase [Oscillospiraceae bacterium]|jgi:hypothetical protein